MPNQDTTTKFKVDISELKKAMQEAKRHISIANSEFKAVSSSMDDWGKSSDGISAKLKQLRTVLSNQESILDSLEKQYNAVCEVQGENSMAADRLRIQMNNQKAVINKTRKEIDGFEKSLDDVTKAEKQAAKTGKTVAEVLDDMEKESEDAGEGFTTLKGAVATFAGNVLTGLANGVKNAIGDMLGLADATREYRTEVAKLETGAKAAGASTEFIREKWQDLTSVLGDEGAVTEGLNNLMAAGFTTEDSMNQVATMLEGAAIKFKDTLKFEGLSDGLQETLATGAAVGPFAELLERSGVNLEKFDAGLAKCKTSAEQQNYVLQQLSSLGLASVSEAYRTQNADLIAANKATADYEANMAALGEKVEPITTKVKEGFNGLLEKLLELVGNVDMDAFTAKIEEGFTILSDDVLPAVVDGLGWVIDNKDELIAGLTGIATAFLAFKVGTLIATVTTALQGMSAATAIAAVKQWLLNSALLANPIVLIVALIAGLIAAFVMLWKNNEEFRQFWIDLWEGIKEACGKAIDAIGKFFTETIPNFFKSVIDWIKANWQSILLFLINPFAGLFKYFYDNNTKFREFVDNAITYIKELPGKIWEWLLKTIAKIIEWRESMIQKAKDAGKKLVQSFIDYIKELPEKLKNIGLNIVQGLWNGINNAKDWLKKKIKSFVGNVTEWLKEFFGIHSPSTVMENMIGKWLPAGIAVGIDKNAKSVINSMKNLAVKTVNTARNGLSNAGGTIGTGGTSGGIVNNFTQVINAPKTPNRLELYRDAKNLLGYVGG